MSHGGDIYRNRVTMDFSVNLNPLGTPKEIIDAVLKALDNAGKYPDQEQEDVRRVIADYEGVDSSCVLAGNGASEMIMAVGKALDPKKALLFEPTFSGYEYVLKSSGCSIKHYTLDERDGFAFSGKAIDDAFEGKVHHKTSGQDDTSGTEKDADSKAENTDLIFLCNPSNPTGLCIEEQLLTNILDTAKAKGAFVCLDESFALMSEKAVKRSAADYLNKYDNLILIKSLTKLLAMPGIRMGYAISSPENISRIKMQLPEWNLSVTSEAAIKAGIKMIGGTDFVKRTIDEIVIERKYLMEELKKLGFRVFDSDTCFVLFKGSEDLFEKLLNEKILIRNCSDHRGLGKGYYRVGARSHEDNIKLIKALQKIV